METVTAVGLLRRRTPVARLRYGRTKHDTEWISYGNKERWNRTRVQWLPASLVL